MRQPVPFGKYLLLDRISVGGMAEVFKAKSYGVEGFEKIIAIKRILPTMGEDRDFIKMFIDEAKIAGQLAHANICQIFELGRIDGSHFIAMEYIWGKDLLQIQNRLRKLKQQMPVPLACFVIGKVLEGLDYAHRKRDPLGRPLEIVHRDCSPQNVLVSYEGEVKVIDFGIAKATSRNSRTMAGVLKGKFGYMSPEQVRGLPLDRRSDIFALGTMLYECLTGERLFQGETDFSTLEKVRNVDIQRPRSINPQIPEVVENVILKALAKDVDDRYQWCGEMLADIQQFLMGQDVVFTAKSLSTWLKEVFTAEIDRERQQLEQYKRVGRDGLIAGLPAAEAKLDVDEHLGEAGMPEGDATTLGGPSFDDIEVAAGAAPDVGPAPGSPATRPRPDDEEFGEEAPTEIFGELGSETPPMQPPDEPRPLSGTQPPLTKPPRPPPGRPVTAAPPLAAAAPISQQMTAQGAPLSPIGRQPSGSVPPLQDGYSTPQASAAVGYPVYEPQYQGYVPPTPPGQVAVSMPGAMSVGEPGPNGLMQTPAGAPSRTVLGHHAPPGMGNYSGGYRPSPPQPIPPSYGGYAQPLVQPTGPYGYPPSYQAQVGTPMGPVDQGIPAEGKRSTLIRDIGIGVAIAAFVLVGFLLVKMFVLDKDDASGGQTSSSTIAMVKLSLPTGITADMYIDDKDKVATVSDKQEVPVTAGRRKIKLVGPGGARCEEAIMLEGGKTTTLSCSFAPPGQQPGLPGPSSAGSGSGSAAAGSGSAAAAGSGSAAAGAAVGSGSAVAAVKTAKPAEVKKPADKPRLTDVKPPEIKPSDTKLKPADTSRLDTTGDQTKGYLQLTSKPTAKIKIDSVDTGMTTPVSGHTLALPPGKHKVTFVIGDDLYTYPVVIKAGATETLNKDLQ